MLPNTHTLETHGAFICARMNMETLAKDVASSKYNCIKTFMDGVVTQVPNNFVEYFTYDTLNGIFKLKNPAERKNPKYEDRLRKTARAIFSRNLFWHMCFFTQYHTAKSLKASRAKKHFMVHNDVGVDYSSDKRLNSVRPIYDSWMKVGTKVVYEWLMWPTGTKAEEAKLEWTFSPANVFGEAMMERLEFIVATVADEFKRAGKGGIIWNLGNESIGEINPTTGKTVQLQSYGDTSQVHAYVVGLWKKYGLEQGVTKKFFAARNIEPSGGTPVQQDRVRAEMFESITRAYGVNGGLGALHELHNDTYDVFMAKVKATAQIKGIPIDKVLHRTIGSSDGSILKHNAIAFAEDNKKLATCPHSAHLFEEGLFLTTNPPVHPSKYDVNWNKYGEFHLRMIE